MYFLRANRRSMVDCARMGISRKDMAGVPE